ncbi:type II toxin-antitoxin system RelE/ParE family toxin [Thiocapsa marina]|uniref:Addiction module toxin, RelE/StbE family n=1 Tax=Thiocapsa marina 5811 TaxID=768671 RepID=F9UA40_9GAMM|nr:type II toxin-antitoxin system RelE/ParE family toxin [Thiocapsa marina]EGV18988.1 addiction module toxin, RelE/StbE family [Thiocapsa marina 5811]
MKIVVSPETRDDLLKIVLHMASDNPDAARPLLKRLRSRITDLEDTPHIGRPGRVPGTRELVIPGTAYIASYQVSGDQLQILRVYHRARQWPDHFEE